MRARDAEGIRAALGRLDQLLVGGGEETGCLVVQDTVCGSASLALVALWTAPLDPRRFSMRYF